MLADYQTHNELELDPTAKVLQVLLITDFNDHHNPFHIVRTFYKKRKHLVLIVVKEKKGLLIHSNLLVLYHPSVQEGVL